ncbi:DUF3368 domain-containing protein [Anabaena azotica]|uniref:DUF3368 domain-containing protein n=1 Tax=Anabaena azotica TaxID=197653 RepID=UPI0039A7299C
MIIIADTSPICYLVLIGEIELLPQLFGKILIPTSVYIELTAKGSPPEVQTWINTPPTWLEIRSVTMLDDPQLKHLHPGEKEAILLAEQLQADLIILDEKAARKAAQQKKLKVTGLLGILDVAASQNLVDIPSAILALQKTNFRAASKLLTSLLNRHQISD